MSDAFIGEIRLFGGNFAPRGWSFCDGQLLAISSHSALFSIVGTIYGGDGRTTFGLPDLRGRVPVHAGTGPGLPRVNLGTKAGQEQNTLQVNQIPSHNHTIPITSAEADQTLPSNNILGATSEDVYAETPSSGSYLGNGTYNTGLNQPVNNMMPSAVVSYIIALVGVYPSRN